jgi:hypothetical protein
VDALRVSVLIASVPGLQTTASMSLAAAVSTLDTVKSDTSSLKAASSQLTASLTETRRAVFAARDEFAGGNIRVLEGLHEGLSGLALQLTEQLAAKPDEDVRNMLRVMRHEQTMLLTTVNGIRADVNELKAASAMAGLLLECVTSMQEQLEGLSSDSYEQAEKLTASLDGAASRIATVQSALVNMPSSGQMSALLQSQQALRDQVRGVTAALDQQLTSTSDEDYKAVLVKMQEQHSSLDKQLQLQFKQLADDLKAVVQDSVQQAASGVKTALVELTTELKTDAKSLSQELVCSLFRSKV